MSDATPRFEPGHEAEGKVPALAAWALYILSIPSANLLVIVGLLVAYAARNGATGVARLHLDAQIALFWQSVWWHVACWVAILVAVILTLTLIGAVIGIPLLIVAGLAWFLLSVWFTIKSVLGLLNLLGDKVP